MSRNVRVNVTLKLIRATFVALENKKLLHILSVCL